VPDGTFAFGGHWYEVISCDDPNAGFDTISWVDAQQIADTRDGHLVCIETAEEREFIFELLEDHPKLRIWTGGYQGVDDWRWINGAAFDKKAVPMQGGLGETIRRIFIKPNMGSSRGFSGDPNNCKLTAGFVIEYTPGEQVSLTLPSETNAETQTYVEQSDLLANFRPHHIEFEF